MQTNAEQKWFVQSTNGDLGPFTVVELRRYVAQGAIHRASMLRQIQSNSWVRADQLPAIFDLRLPLKHSSAVELSQPSAVAPIPPPIHENVSGSFKRSKLNWLAIASPVVSVLLVLVILTLVKNNSASSMAEAIQSAEAEEALRTSSNTIESPEVTSGLTSPNDSTKQSEEAITKPEARLTIEQVVDRTKQSVALIQTESGSGSGFVIEPGLLVTNYHVIADGDIQSIQVFFPDGTGSRRGPFRVEIICEAPDRDLALLQIDRSIPAVAIDTSHRFRRGQAIVIIGSPGVGADLLENAVTSGILSSEIDIGGRDSHCYQLSASVNPGNSGGPVFDMNGKAIGVVVARATQEEGISFCIPVSDLVRLVESQRTRGLISTGRAQAEHSARQTLRALNKQVNALTAIYINVIPALRQEFESRSVTFSSRDLIELVNEKMKSQNPELIEDFSFRLGVITNDQDLLLSHRIEIDRLVQRHLSLKAFLKSPPPDIERFTNRLADFKKQFDEQLETVDRVFPLGIH